MGVAALLSRRDIRGMFFKRLEEVEEASWASLISHMFDSDQDQETYRFLGNVPSLRRWRGSRRKTEPKGFEIKVVNDEFESTLEIALRDMRRDKTGQVQIRINDLATRAAQLPQKTLSTLIQSPGNGYDGIAYFGNHTTGRGSRVNNLLTDTTVADGANPTSAEMANAILTSIETILGVLDDQGEPMNEFARQFVVMVPTALWSAAIAAVQDRFTSAGVSNTLMGLLERSAPQGGIEVVPVHNPRLAAPAGGASIFYTFRSDGDIKPWIWQDDTADRDRVEFDVLGEGSDHAFHNQSHLFGVKRIGEAASGAYEMSTKMTLS